MSSPSNTSLVIPGLADWALKVVATQQPEEIPAFVTLAQPYLTPGGALRKRVRGGRSDEALGSGMEFAAFVTPAVLFMCDAAWKVLMGAVQDNASQGLSHLFERLRHREESTEKEVSVVVDVETLRLARQRALERGMAAGLDEAVARACADAVIGALLEKSDGDD
jgi:hypothetical protein